MMCQIQASYWYWASGLFQHSTGPILACFPVLSLGILEASDFDKVAGTAIYYPQYFYMKF